jgi:hypothetical protein
MTKISLSSKSNDSSLSVLKLCDDGSNWADYEPQIRKAMGAKGIWKFVEGTAYQPKRYAIIAGKYMIVDGKTKAMEDQVEMREEKVDKYEWKENLAQHILLLMMSPCIGSKIKNLHTANEMWTVIQTDMTSKSMLFIIDAEDQLASMHCTESTDPKGHLAEVKAHFDLMMKCHNNGIPALRDAVRHHDHVISTTSELHG